MNGFIDDVASGAVKYLKTFSSLTSLLGSYPASDAVNGGKAFIFRTTGDSYRGTLARVQGTQSSALVVSTFGSYQAAMPMTTPRFQRLSVEVFTDPLRDSDLNITETPGGTELRCRQVLSQVIFTLQRTDPETIAWGSLLTTGCQFLTEGPVMMLTGAEGDGLMHVQVFFGVDTFGYVNGVISA